MTASPSAFSTEIQEFAPSLLPWSELGPTVVRLIQAHEPLARRILLAPPKWLHVVAVYLWRTQGADIGELAQSIYEKHPRQLLNECWAEADLKLYPVLKRCGRKALMLEQYEKLNTILGSNIADIALQTKALNAARIEFFFKIREMDPLVAPAYRQLNFDLETAKRFDIMLKHMRKLDIIGDHISESKLLRNGAFRSTYNYVEARLTRVKAPDNLNLAAPLRQIMLGEELLFIANQWKNCLRTPSYRISLGLGSRVFILLDGDEPGHAIALASFERTAFGWQMDECTTSEKRRASPELRQRIVNLLSLNGVSAYATTFEMALSALDRCPDQMVEEEWHSELEDTERSEH